MVTFGDEVTKIRKHYIIFVYILQGKMGKTEKKQKENHATKVTKKPKRERPLMTSCIRVGRAGGPRLPQKRDVIE